MKAGETGKERAFANVTTGSNGRAPRRGRRSESTHQVLLHRTWWSKEPKTWPSWMMAAARPHSRRIKKCKFSPCHLFLVVSMPPIYLMVLPIFKASQPPQNVNPHTYLSRQTQIFKTSIILVKLIINSNITKIGNIIWRRKWKYSKC